MRQHALLAFLLVSAVACEHVASAPQTEPSEVCRLPNEDDFRIEHPVNPTEELYNELLPSQLAVLYEAVGQYASGDVPVYEGPLDATEYMSAVVGREDQTIDTTRALASLRYQENLERAPIPQGYVLLVFDPEEQKMLRLFQASHDPTLTYASSVSPYRSSWAIDATCTSCLLDLGSVESRFDVDLVARGTYLDFEMSEMRVDVRGAFERIPVDELSLDDLLVVGSRYEFPEFNGLEPRLEGDTYVFDVQDEVRTSGVDADGCYESVSYEIEWFVHRDCLLDYGPRNLRPDEPRRRCSTGG